MSKNDDRTLFLSDVDGVAAGLMEGFSSWMHEVLHLELPVHLISKHSEMGKSPGLQNLRVNLSSMYPRFQENPDGFVPGSQGRHTSIGAAFLEFMKTEHVYEKWVKPVPGSIEALSHINEGYRLIWVTATMKDAPQNYESKFRWLAYYFPNVRMCSIPSELKQYFGAAGALAVDDRFDICQDWNAREVTAMCFKQPWSQEPEGAQTYNWDQIVSVADHRRELLHLLSKTRLDFQGEF